LKSADWKEAAEKVSKGITDNDVYNSALEYALQQDSDDCKTFLELWNEGCWPEIRKDFPDYVYPGGFPY
jgi:U3 small nucleolar RNA-associated protein 14